MSLRRKDAGAQSLGVTCCRYGGVYEVWRTITLGALIDLLYIFVVDVHLLEFSSHL